MLAQEIKCAYVRLGAKLPAELLDKTIEHIELGKLPEFREASRKAPAQNKPCRRQHLRVAADDIRIRYTVGARPQRFSFFSHRARLVNISIGGVCLEVGKALEPDEALVLYVSGGASNDIEEFPIQGRVLNRVLKSGRRYQYNIRFEATPASTLRNSINQRTMEEKINTRDPG